MNTVKTTLVVLAAGMGSRYGGLKQMDGLGPAGEVLLEYSVFDALEAGFGDVVFIIRKDIEEAFSRYVISRLPAHLSYRFAYQELDKLPPGFRVPEGRTKPWGTSHALWCARNEVQGPFAVLNADDFYGKSGFRKLVAFFQNQTDPHAAALVGYRLDKTLSESGSVARGICRSDARGFLTDIQEKTDIERLSDGRLVCDRQGSELELQGNELVSMNFWGFTPRFFDFLESEAGPWFSQHGQDLKSEFLLPKSVGKGVSEDKLRVQVLDSEDEWIGVTYAEDKEPTRKKLQGLTDARVYVPGLWGK